MVSDSFFKSGSVTYAIVSHFWWVLLFVPFIPPSPIKLFLGIWILYPSLQGEAVVYMLLKHYLDKFMVAVTKQQAKLCWYLTLKAVNSVSAFIDYTKGAMDTEQLTSLMKDAAAPYTKLNNEVGTRKKLDTASPAPKAAVVKDDKEK